MTDAQALAKAAQQLVGTPFRLRGRDAKTGVDCIGLVALALSRIGRPVPALPPYGMRNLDRQRFSTLLQVIGLTGATNEAQPGDIVLLRPSAAQYHLAIIGPAGLLIHAHAGLGRVVASLPPLPWPIESCWRLGEKLKEE